MSKNIIIMEYISPECKIVELIMEQNVLSGSTTVDDLIIEDLN